MLKLLFLTLAAFFAFNFLTTSGIIHEHVYQEDWVYDDTRHWHTCSVDGCKKKNGVAEHLWDDGVVTTNATCTTDGVKTFTCTCGATKTEQISASSDYHVIPDGEFACSNCNVFLVENDEQLLTALSQDKAEISVILKADVSLDVNAWDALALGTVNTEKITIDGNDTYKLTFNQLNSDWNNVILANESATLILKNTTINNAGYNNGPWIRYDINFACTVELTNVTSEKAIAIAKKAVLSDVTVNETIDAYAIWARSGCNISINNLTVNSAGRGIKISDQYIGQADRAVSSITFSGNNKFTTVKKAAVLVGNTAGAKVTVNAGATIDISGVTADTTNLVWIDNGKQPETGEAYTASAASVVVTGASCIVEP